MEILLNPNVAYLILVAGFMIAVLALVTPGTGILELLAVVTLMGAGYAMINLPINWWALGLLIIGVIPFFLAMRKSGRVIYLVISITAFIIGSTYLFQGETWYLPGVNPLLAVVVSVLSAGFLYLLVFKAIEVDKMRPVHDISTLIGSVGEAKTPIMEEGSVQVEGELWSAYSKEPIPSGAQVRVIGREGFILEVEPIH